MKLLATIILSLFCWTLAAQEYAHDDDYIDGDRDLPYVEIIEESDFAALGREARLTGKVIMLAMSATYCDYCRTLEEEIIKPMLRSGDYEDNVLIRKLEIDSHASIRHFNGATVTPARLARDFNVFVTPTLIFLDGQGQEVSERILGVNTLEFFGAYVDDALSEGRLRICKTMTC